MLLKNFVFANSAAIAFASICGTIIAPSRPGNTLSAIFSLNLSKHSITPPRGPRNVFWVPNVTISALFKSFGITEAAINPDIYLEQYIQEAIDNETIQNITNPNPFRKTTPFSPLPGEIIIGSVVESQIPWALSLNQLTNKILITGRSGGGKTNLVLLILAQILQRENND
jgi:hypothetical protein